MNEDLVPSSLDEHFARLMVRLNGRADADLENAARTVSAWRNAGHACMPLSALETKGVAKKLRSMAVVGSPGEFKPLILDESDRLYLQRYWQYESDLAAAIRIRLDPAQCDEPLLVRGLDRWFAGVAEDDGQRMAAQMAVREKFCVLTGGPGTGKTYTVARILALLGDQIAATGRDPRFALVAPTGKAAARMQESIAHSIASMPNAEALRAWLPGEASTIHRLLGTISDSPYFRHDRNRPLTVDALVVDEASMVDLALMAKLLDAIPQAARVILLGDKDQLASVEAGNVLGDICGAGQAKTSAPIAAHIAELKKPYRFSGGSGIEKLGSLVNSGNAEGALETLRSGAHSDLLLAPTPPARGLEAALRPRAIEGWRNVMIAADAGSALKRLADFRILCATRRGPAGVENLNLLAERALATEGLIDPDGTHYHGRPILIGANDYQLRLFNGDVGLILRDPESDNDLRAFFLDSAGEVRRVLPARLPAHETSFAMTVHKSQGSEFDRVLLVLPDRDSPILTRELLYTGLTRARHSVEIWAGESILAPAILRRTERTSGLRDALWGGADSPPVARVRSRKPTL